MSDIFINREDRFGYQVESLYIISAESDSKQPF